MGVGFELALVLILTYAPILSGLSTLGKATTCGRLGILRARRPLVPWRRQMAVIGIAEVTATRACEQSGAGTRVGSGNWVTVKGLTAGLITVSAS